jgi:hypothetical protein
MALALCTIGKWGYIEGWLSGRRAWLRFTWAPWRAAHFEMAMGVIVCTARPISRSPCDLSFLFLYQWRLSCLWAESRVDSKRH